MPGADARVLVVIPALNEASTVQAVIGEVRAAVPTAEILVVDDGSDDATARLARSAGALVAQLPFNVGVGGALRTGFHYAIEAGFAVAVQIDADGQHDPAVIPALVEGLADADVVIGARFAGVGDYEVRGPRAWAMRVFASVLSRSSGTRLTDVTSGLRAFGPRAIELFAEHLPAEYLGDTIEALVIANRAGLVVRQIPTRMRARAGGAPSHNPFRAALYLGRATMALVVARLRPRAAFGVRA